MLPTTRIGLQVLVNITFCARPSSLNGNKNKTDPARLEQDQA